MFITTLCFVAKKRFLRYRIAKAAIQSFALKDLVFTVENSNLPSKTEGFGRKERAWLTNRISRLLKAASKKVSTHSFRINHIIHPVISYIVNICYSSSFNVFDRENKI